MAYLLSIDPATGSSSKPGFALWELRTNPPQLVDCGTITVKGNTHWQRMRDLSLRLPATLLDCFGGDVKGLDLIKLLVIEGLAPVMGISSGGKHFGNSNTAFVHLHHAVAVLCTCYAWNEIEELPPQTWKSFLNHMCLADVYKKSDLHDAVVIGLATLCRIGFPPPQLPLPLLQAMFPSTKKTPRLDPELWSMWSSHIAKSRATSAKAKKSKRKAKGGSK